YLGDDVSNVIYILILFDFLPICNLPLPELFPYTTLFRSARRAVGDRGHAADAGAVLRGTPHPRLRFAPARVHGMGTGGSGWHRRSEEHTSELQSRENLVRRLLLEKQKYRHSGSSYAHDGV